MYLYNNKYLFWHKASSKKTPFPGLSVMKYVCALGVNAEGVCKVWGRLNLRQNSY